MSKTRLSFSGGGPKTPRGKMRSSRNSRRHGFFASEFSFSAADELIFDKFSENLLIQLGPDNSIQDLLAQDVVACGWRMRTALRYEQQELQKQFAIEREGGRLERQAVETSFLYPPNARQNHQSIKLLDELKARAQTLKSLPPEFEERVTEAFGADFWKTLQEWMPVDRAEEKKFVKADGVKQLEMIYKLIDLYRHSILTTFGNSAERGGRVMCDEWVSRLDLAIRYLTTARRDFYRALREYREAKTSC